MAKRPFSKHGLSLQTAKTKETIWINQDGKETLQQTPTHSTNHDETILEARHSSLVSHTPVDSFIDLSVVIECV